MPNILVPDPNKADGKPVNANANITTKAGAPGPNDDATAGFSVNSIIVDTTTNRTWVCTSAEAGHATWVEVAGVSNRFDSIEVKNVVTGKYVTMQVYGEDGTYQVILGPELD